MCGVEELLEAGPQWARDYPQLLQLKAESVTTRCLPVHNSVVENIWCGEEGNHMVLVDLYGQPLVPFARVPFTGSSEDARAMQALWGLNVTANVHDAQLCK